MSEVPDTEPLLEIVVMGKPEPRGSKQGMPVYKNRGQKIPARREDGSIIVNVVDSNAGPSDRWMEQVAWEARARVKHRPLEEVAVEVSLTFFVARPEGHFRTGKNSHLLRDSAPAYPRVRPDADKLARPVLDALTDVVWNDDGQVAGLSIDKRYAVPVAADNDGQGVLIRVGLSEKQTADELDADLRRRWVADGQPELFAA